MCQNWCTYNTIHYGENIHHVFLLVRIFTNNQFLKNNKIAILEKKNVILSKYGGLKSIWTKYDHPYLNSNALNSNLPAPQRTPQKPY